MGKNKKNIKNNVFKVAGAKSLKKMKLKEVVLGLKPIKNKIEEIDKEFIEIQKNVRSKSGAVSCKTIQRSSLPKREVEASDKNVEKVVISKNDIAETSEKLITMDL